MNCFVQMLHVGQFFMFCQFRLLTFFKNKLFFKKKKSFRTTIKVSNGWIHQDRHRRSVGPYPGPNYFQRLSQTQKSPLADEEFKKTFFSSDFLLDLIFFGFSNICIVQYIKCQQNIHPPSVHTKNVTNYVRSCST